MSLDGVTSRLDAESAARAGSRDQGGVPRHVVYFRLLGNGGAVRLLRLLHDRMLPDPWLPTPDVPP